MQSEDNGTRANKRPMLSIPRFPRPTTPVMYMDLTQSEPESSDEVKIDI